MDGSIRLELPARQDGPQDIASVLGRFGRMVKLSLRAHNLRRHGIDDEDVEQEVRIRLWTALVREPDKEMPAAYVQKVVFSAVVDAVRREGVRRRDIDADADGCAGEFPDPCRQPDAYLAQRQWADHLHRSIAQLAPRRRRPVQLFLLGYSFQETADACRLTLDACSKLVRRGLADLRSRLRDHRGPD